MNLNHIRLLTFIILICSLTYGQQEKYNRSSLSMVLIESDRFPNYYSVMKSWNNFPFPDKYNQHIIQAKQLNFSSIYLTDQDLVESGFLMDTLVTSEQISRATANNWELRYLNSNKSEAVVIPKESQLIQAKIDKFIRNEKIANQVIKAWFINDNGLFDMSAVADRGHYNASELEASIAKGQVRGVASLGDAGDELIKNSFVTFTSLEFIENEPIARVIRDEAQASIRKKMEGMSEVFVEMALEGPNVIYKKTKEGYSLWSKTWLYRLVWNDRIAENFYEQLWNNYDALGNSDLFELVFVGFQKNQSLVTFKLGESRTHDQIIDLALVRNLDNSFAELQKDHDIFKPKVPVLSVNPIKASIGMKEGLNGGEKFDVYEMQYNSKTGKTEYKFITVVKAIKKLVWDNRYYAGEKTNEIMDEYGNVISATTFKGSNKVKPGMLLIQRK